MRLPGEDLELVITTTDVGSKAMVATGEDRLQNGFAACLKICPFPQDRTQDATQLCSHGHTNVGGDRTGDSKKAETKHLWLTNQTRMLSTHGNSLVVNNT